VSRWCDKGPLHLILHGSCFSDEQLQLSYLYLHSTLLHSTNTIINYHTE
jgi:hypothetical protein